MRRDGNRALAIAAVKRLGDEIETSLIEWRARRFLRFRDAFA
jgi:hypothetical protein